MRPEDTPGPASEPRYSVAVLAGDGIGPECIEAAVMAMSAAAEANHINLEFRDHEAGAGLYARTGEAISVETVEAVGQADATLLGAMGLPHVRQPNGLEVAPQIDLREQYGLYASLRPARRLDGVPPTIVARDVDMLVVRETTEGLFAGRHDVVKNGGTEASDRLTVTRSGCERLFHQAFRQARKRMSSGGQGRVTLFDKANVLKSFVFMRAIFDEVAAQYPEIESERLYIDAGCMLMILDPGRFDVIVTENQFGDIASEVAAGLVGGLGLCPSADVSDEHGVFQPSHGSAPDIAGTGVANPVATILSGAMMLEWLSGKHRDPRCMRAAQNLRVAVQEVLVARQCTPDLRGTATTKDMAAAITLALENVG